MGASALKGAREERRRYRFCLRDLTYDLPNRLALVWQRTLLFRVQI
jgi:hypothetical protein